METDTRLSCPICKDYKAGEPLEDHLQTHTKESLISTLLHLNQNTTTNTAGPQSDPNFEQDFSDYSKQQESIGSNCETTEAQSNVEFKILQQCSQNDDADKGDVDRSSDEQTNCDNLISKHPNVTFISCETENEFKSSGGAEVNNGASHSRTSTKCENPAEVLIVAASRSEDLGEDPSPRINREMNEDDLDDNTYTILQTMSVSTEDSKRLNEITIAELAGATEIPKSWSVAQIYPDDCNLSTAIKYIIDETDNGNTVKKEEQVIFLDGRCIPVYSSLSELRCASPVPPPEDHVEAKIGAEVPSSSRQALHHESDESTNLDVDLMTDEEIPPQGEISEFEESSASVMSDDSVIRSRGFDSSLKTVTSAGTTSARHMSPSLSDEAVAAAAKIQAKSATRASATPFCGGSTSRAEEFVCFDDCQNHTSPKQFASLFEMIQHKSGILPSKLKKPDDNNEASIGSAKSLQEHHHHHRNLARSSLPDGQLRNSEGLLPEPAPMASVLQRKNYFCLYCDFTSQSKIVLNSHCKAEHPDRDMNPDKFECCTCGKIFAKRASLRKHLLTHKQRLFECNMCSKSFPSKYKLMEHSRIHTGVYPYKCNQCDKAYRTPSLLATHEKKVHRTADQDRVAPKKLEFMCGICHRVMHSKRTLESHVQLHKQKPQKCPHCSETFPRTSVLVRHIRASHDPLYTSVKTKDCSICGKYYHPNSMKAHMLIHKKEKPHKCPVCNKNFRTLGNLNNHSWSHTGAERPYKCSSCPKSYIFLRSLQNHAMVHKRKTLHFVCNECGVKFTNKCNLKRHVEEHTAEKKFKCLICGKKFFRHYYLVEHVRIHSGSRPYTCTICGKASSTKSNHVAHVKIHDARESGNLEG